MRNFIFSLLFLLSGCASSPQVTELPQPLYQEGTNFSLPCAEHGSHMQTIKGHSIAVIYSIEDDQGNVQEVPEYIVTQIFEMLSINFNE